VNASLLEVVFFLVSGTGLGFSLWNVRDSHHDVRAVRLLGINSAAEYTARSSRSSEIIRAVALGALTLVALIAMFAAPRPSPGASPVVYRATVIGLFLLFDVLLALGTFVTARSRRAVLKLLSEKGGT